MNTLQVLEKKITELIESVKKLKVENAELKKTNSLLEQKLETLDQAMVDERQKYENLDQEKSLTKMAVDDLIHSIDSLIENEKQS